MRLMKLFQKNMNKTNSHPAFVLMIAGQVLTGIVFSHFGLMGSPIEPISFMKIVGVVLLMVGVSIITFSK